MNQALKNQPDARWHPTDPPALPVWTPVSPSTAITTTLFALVIIVPGNCLNQWQTYSAISQIISNIALSLWYCHGYWAWNRTVLPKHANKVVMNFKPLPTGHSLSRETAQWWLIPPIKWRWRLKLICHITPILLIDKWDKSLGKTSLKAVGHQIRGRRLNTRLKEKRYTRQCHSLLACSSIWFSTVQFSLFVRKTLSLQKEVKVVSKGKRDFNKRILNG